MTTRYELYEICAARRIGVHSSSAERSQGQPWVFLKNSGPAISEFFSAYDALQWLPPRTVAVTQLRSLKWQWKAT
jgi:hypothetical protein